MQDLTVSAFTVKLGEKDEFWYTTSMMKYVCKTITH